MALKKCTECGKEMSSEARKCPHCGKTYTTVGGIFIAVIIALIIGGCVFSQGCSDRAKWDAALDTSSTRVLTTVQTCLIAKDRPSVEALRAAITDARKLLEKEVGSATKRAALKKGTDSAADGVRMILEDGTPEQKELAKLLEGL